MDVTTVIGLVVGFGAILLGNSLEGGHLDSLLQMTAALIVFGGTIGAVLIATPIADVRMGIELLRLAFKSNDHHELQKIRSDLVAAAQLARKESLLALESKLNSFSHSYTRDVFRFVIDGVDPVTLRGLFESEMRLYEERCNAGCKMWTDAGGFSPTIGIIGAVLGLIHVMSNLTDTSKLGAGIAVAFVATIYGVAAANLFFLPISNKIKRKIRSELEVKEMILEAALAIGTGVSPFIVEQKLLSYAPETKPKSA